MGKNFTFCSRKRLILIYCSKAFQIVCTICRLFFLRGHKRFKITAVSQKHDHLLKPNFHMLVLWFESICIKG